MSGPINFAYIRISTNEQSKGSSLDTQKNAILDYCQRNGLVLDEKNIFTDIESGSKMDRPNFDALRNTIKSTPAVHKVIVYAIDRLARSVFVAEVVAKEIQEKGGSIVSVTQGFDDSTPHGKMTRQMLVVMAELELSLISGRVSAGRKATVAKGLHGGGNVRFGMKSEGGYGKRGFGKLKKSEKEAQAFEKMKLLRKEGKSYQEIADALALDKILNRRHKPFNRGSIKKMLDNYDMIDGSVVEAQDISKEIA